MSDLARRYTYKVGTTVLGGQHILNMDAFSREYFQASLHVDLVSGSMVVQPEYSMSDMIGDASSLRWFPYGEPMTVTTLLLVDKPVTGLRLNITEITGEVRLTVLQGVTS
jgi:hypothetical protein